MALGNSRLEAPRGSREARNKSGQAGSTKSPGLATKGASLRPGLQAFWDHPGGRRGRRDCAVLCALQSNLGFVAASAIF
jgi:hypothetical protein